MTKRAKNIARRDRARRIRQHKTAKRERKNPPVSKVISVRPEVIDKIAGLIQSGRKYFGSSGASLTHEVSGTGSSGFSRKVVEIGMRGERNTTLMLKHWAKDKDNVVVIDSVHLKPTGAKMSPDGKDTDHVIVMGNAIVLIDSKAWKRGYSYKISKKGRILRGNRNFRGGAVHAKQSLHLWRSFFPEVHNFFSYVCVQQKDVSVIFDNQWKRSPFKLIARQDLFSSLDWAYEKCGAKDTPLNPRIVSKIVISAIKPRDILGEVVDVKKFHV